LFAPLSLRGVTFRNRIGVSPMCQYSSEAGFAHDWHLVHLGGFAVGGAGLVMTEATAVLPEGRISPQDMGIWSDAHVPFLGRIADFVHAQGAVAGVQLAHAGRKASTYRPWSGHGAVPVSEGGWANVVAPSALPFSEHFPSPVALNADGITAIVDAFRAGARRVLDAGFHVIEVHAAHGYLLHEFLSPISNVRTDSYGGSLTNRARLLLEVVDAIRSVWPERYPLLVRLSATEWAPGGWDIEEAVELGVRLKDRAVDLIDCSSGGNVSGVKIPTGPGYQVPFARRIRRESGMHTGAVGLITDAVQAERIVADGNADMIFLAREMLRQPHWPLLAARELGVQVDWPKQYERARGHQSR
jgi:2,4-dienoyl-CoA reductase-like NADH-dependent reductase (Old Yellow Enzyme family)